MRLEAVPGHGWYQQHLDSSGPHKTFLITGVRWEDKRGHSAIPKPTPKCKASNPFQLAAKINSTVIYNATATEPFRRIDIKFFTEQFLNATGKKVNVALIRHLGNTLELRFRD